MATTAQRPKLIAIVGPTASGKSWLAMMIATVYSGEIIAADSRTIYRGMNIGTAKPNHGEQAVVPHWGLDLVEPGEFFSAHDFKEYAQQKIGEIQGRGNLPIIVGGTGLYVDSVLFNFGFRPKASKAERNRLEAKSLEQLQKIIEARGYPKPSNFKNRRHLIRAIETEGQVMSQKKRPLAGTLIIGLLLPDETLLRNIHERAEEMFKQGLVEETEKLLERYGGNMPGAAGLGYKEIVEYLGGRVTRAEAKKLVERAHWQYARRQRTWFKRNKFIKWFEDPKLAYKQISQLLSN